MLKIGEANNAARAMRGAALVSRSVTLDAEHAFASTREMIEGRAPHCAEPTDHDIKNRHAASHPRASARVNMITSRRNGIEALQATAPQRKQWRSRSHGRTMFYQVAPPGQICQQCLCICLR